MKECQSCTLPLGNDDYEPVDNFGTNKDGTSNEEYCEYCFQNGEFTEPNLSLEEMIDRVTKIYVEQLEMPLEIARGLATTRIPHLNRWSNKN